MEQIQTLSTMRGRAVFRDVFRELRFEKQVSSWTALTTCWRISVSEREIFRFSKQKITVLHPLGFWGGSSIFLQEIVNRYYFTTINSLVYFGAAILLVIIGIYRFSAILHEGFVIAGVIFEALLLMFMFVVMFFSPVEDSEYEERNGEKEEEESEIQQIVREIGEIGSDYAGFTGQVDEVTTTLSGLLARQDELIASVNEVAKLSAKAVQPQPELLKTMHETTLALKEFSQTVAELSTAAKALRREEIQQEVRKEVERVLEQRIR